MSESSACDKRQKYRRLHSIARHNSESGKGMVLGIFTSGGDAQGIREQKLF